MSRRTSLRGTAVLLIGLLAVVTGCQGMYADLLEAIKARGEIVVVTDPDNAPRSRLDANGTFEGFDIDVASEIGRRLGVDVRFEAAERQVMTEGSWQDQWDIGVASIAITTDRKQVLDFTEPYAYTPAQMAASDASGITGLEELSNQAICAGESTTYEEWLQGTLSLVDAPEPAEPPAGITVTVLPTDMSCAEAWAAGRQDFAGWLSSSTTVQSAIDEGVALHTVGVPVFFEPLAVVADLGGPPRARLMDELNTIIQQMHDDGTLSDLSTKWFSSDLTTAS